MRILDKYTKAKSSSGFSLIEVCLVIVAAALLITIGAVIYNDRSQSAPSEQAGSPGQASDSDATYTDAQLIAVAKKVYFQGPGEPISGPNAYVSFCGVGHTTCPFTAHLDIELSDFSNTLVKDHSPFGNVLVGGLQNSVGGLISYAAVSSSGGGTVTVVNGADAAQVGQGDPTITWKLTLVDVDGNLLVNNIIIRMTNTSETFKGIDSCGPVEIYDDLSC